MAEINEIALEKLPEAIQAALLKLHLVVTGETTRLLAEFGTSARGVLLGAADEDGKLDAIRGFSAVAEVEQRWRDMFTAWTAMFEAARWQAGALAFGGLARQHQGMMGLGVDEGRGARGGKRLLEQEDSSPVFEPQLQAVLDAASQRVWSDGFQLSQRIWRLDRESLDGIRRTLLNGIASGDSAWKLAQELEQFLGADGECPRWTSTRLYKLTPTERMVSRKGLLSSVMGTPCESKGVAYKALRLARNEIQIAHMRATDAIWGNVPWIEQEQIVLSPDHPPISCECEDVVAGGENGDGVYPKGEITLPLHIQ
jgi:hypothetical protein